MEGISHGVGGIVARQLISQILQFLQLLSDILHWVVGNHRIIVVRPVGTTAARLFGQNFLLFAHHEKIRGRLAAGRSVVRLDSLGLDHSGTGNGCGRDDDSLRLGRVLYRTGSLARNLLGLGVRDRICLR